jgi:hypothetical protein
MQFVFNCVIPEHKRKVKVFNKENLPVMQSMHAVVLNFLLTLNKAM